MTRALMWSLVGSMAAVIAIGVSVTALTWAAPAIQMRKSASETFTLLGHSVTIRLDVTPAPPRVTGMILPEHGLAWLLLPGREHFCTVIP